MFTGLCLASPDRYSGTRIWFSALNTGAWFHDLAQPLSLQPALTAIYEKNRSITKGMHGKSNSIIVGCCL